MSLMNIFLLWPPWQLSDIMKPWAEYFCHPHSLQPEVMSKVTMWIRNQGTLHAHCIYTCKVYSIEYPALSSFLTNGDHNLQNKPHVAQRKGKGGPLFPQTSTQPDFFFKTTGVSNCWLLERISAFLYLCNFSDAESQFVSLVRVTSLYY